MKRSTYCFFFFSSRRRHTRSDRDWSSDVCSSDLRGRRRRRSAPRAPSPAARRGPSRCRSEERRVGKSVDLGGRRIIKKKKQDMEKNVTNYNSTYKHLVINNVKYINYLHIHARA